MSVELSLLLSVAGSTHVPQCRAIFEVKKCAGQESPSGQVPEDSKESEILAVTIFRELRGCSEVVIFLSPSPIRCVYGCVWSVGMRVDVCVLCLYVLYTCICTCTCTMYIHYMYTCR